MKWRRKLRPPGLGKVTQRFLERSLDKNEQCSDWDERPLTENQLR